MGDEVKDALRLAVDYDNRPRTKSSDARKLDVGKYQSGISERDYAEIMQRNNLQTRDAYAQNVKEPGPHADQLGHIGEYDPVNVEERVAASRKYGPSTVVDPEGRKGNPLFVAGTTPTGENVPLNLGQQAGLAEHLSRMFEYKTKGDYAAGRTWANPQKKLPFGLSGSTLGMNKAYKGNDPGYALPHEIGHVIHDYQGRAANPLGGAPQQATDEFEQMALKRRLFDYGAPDARGNYTEDPREQWAEGVKAYLTNPAKFKSEYPEAAKFMRKIINTDPKLNKLLMLSRREGPQYAAHGGEINDALRLAQNVRRRYAGGGSPVVGTNPAQTQPTTATPNPQTQQSPMGGTQSYINSLYRNIMGREADTEGAQYWQDQINSGAQNQGQVLQNFAGSQEFQNLYKTDPSRAITALYDEALGRAPDQGGLQYWQEQAKQGLALPTMTENFLNSTEGKQVSTISQAYQQATGNVPTDAQIVQAQQALSSGQSFDDFLSSVYETPESTAYAADQLYREYTGEGATPEQVKQIQARFGSGEDYGTIAQDILATPQSKSYLNNQFLNDTFAGYGLTPTEAQKSEFSNLMQEGKLSQLDIDKAIGKLPGAGTGDFEAPYQVAGATVPSGKAIPTTPARYQEYIKDIIQGIGSTLSGGAQKLFDFIGQGEGGYNSANSGTGKGARMTHDASQWLGKALKDFTLGEIMKMQEGTPATGRKLFAVGKFQMIPRTLKEMVQKLGIDTSLKFDEALQNRLGTALVLSKRPNLGKYLLGLSDNQDKAMKEFSQEFMSVPYYKTGKSFIPKGGNHPLHTVAQSRNALKQARLAGFGVTINPNGGTEFADQPTGDLPPSQPGAPPANDEASQEEFLRDQGIGVAPGGTGVGGTSGGVSGGTGVGGIGGTSGGPGGTGNTGGGTAPGSSDNSGSGDTGVYMGPMVVNGTTVVPAQPGYYSDGGGYNYASNYSWSPEYNGGAGTDQPWYAGWVDSIDNVKNGGRVTGNRVKRGLKIAHRATGGTAIKDALRIADKRKRDEIAGSVEPMPDYMRPFNELPEEKKAEALRNRFNSFSPKSGASNN